MSWGPPPEMRMAGDIARQFAWMGAEAAAERVAGHIEKFWTPEMIDRLIAQVADGETEVPALVADAAALLARDQVDQVDQGEIAEPSGG